MLNPELEIADNLCMKNVALPVLIQLVCILELHNCCFSQDIYNRTPCSCNELVPSCLKGKESKKFHTAESNLQTNVVHTEESSG